MPQIVAAQACSVQDRFESACRYLLPRVHGYGEHYVWPVGMGQVNVRASLTKLAPANPLESPYEIRTRRPRQSRAHTSHPQSLDKSIARIVRQRKSRTRMHEELGATPAPLRSARRLCQPARLHLRGEHRTNQQLDAFAKG